MDAANDQMVSELWSAYFKENSVLHRNRLFQYYSSWLKKIVSGFYLKKQSSLLQWSDYMQNAAVALIETIERFDISHGVPFEGYAYVRIKGALLNTYNKEISTNTSIENQAVLDENENYLEIDLDFDSFIDSVISVAFSQLLDVSAQRVSDISSNPLDLQILYCEEKMIMDAVGKLDENLRFIVIAHYQYYMSFKEIAESLGLSKSRISQLHSLALYKLRFIYEEN